MAKKSTTTKSTTTIEETGAQDRRVQFELLKLKERGILIDIDSNGTSKFIKRAKWGEVGVGDSDGELKEMFTSGSKFFARTYYKALRSKAEGARQITNKLAKDVTGFRPWLWLPITAYDEWKAEVDRFISEYGEVKRELLANYDPLVDEYNGHIANIAFVAWKKLSLDGTTSVTVDGVKFGNRANFVDHVVAQASAKLPTKAQLKEELSLSYTSAVLDSEDIGGSLMAYEQSIQQRELMQAESRKRTAELYAGEQKAYEEAKTAETKANAEREAIRIRLEEIKKAEAANARARLSDIASPFEEVFNQVRASFVESIDKGLDAYKKNGRIPGKTAEMLRGLPELFKIVSVGKDDELLAKLEQLKTLCSTSEEKTVDQVAINALLEDLKNTATTTAEEVKKVGGRFAYLDIN